MAAPHRNPWPATLNNLHGALDEFVAAVGRKDFDEARELIIDIRQAFQYVEDHGESLMRPAARYVADHMARGIPPQRGP